MPFSHLHILIILWCWGNKVWNMRRPCEPKSYMLAHSGLIVLWESVQECNLEIRSLAQAWTLFFEEKLKVFIQMTCLFCWVLELCLALFKKECRSIYPWVLEKDCLLVITNCSCVISLVSGLSFCSNKFWQWWQASQSLSYISSHLVLVFWGSLQ